MLNPNTLQLSPAVIHAAQFVLKSYLSKPYTEGFQDGGRENGFDKKFIDRPIHGLAHTLRTLAFAPVVLEQFKIKYPETYAKIDAKELEKIMIAQLFFVAGRESENSTSKDYLRYHQFGAQYFEEYAREHLTGLFTEADIMKYKGIIEDADTKYKNLPQAKIIAYCHGIDLIRTRSDKQYFYELTAQEREELIAAGRTPYNGMGATLRTVFGDEAALAICEFAWSLIKATGDSCQPYIVAPGKEGMGANVGEKWPADALTFEKPLLQTTPTFEKCQYSVEACLNQINSVKSPLKVVAVVAQEEQATEPTAVAGGIAGRVATISPQFALLRELKAKKKALKQEAQMFDDMARQFPQEQQYRQFSDKLNVEVEQTRGLIRAVKAH